MTPPVAGPSFEQGRLTTERTESTEAAVEKDPFTGQVIGCAIEVHRVQRLADGIERCKL